MTLEVHTVDLRARDGISPVLRQVSGSAQTMARDVDMAAESGRRGFERFSAAGAALGMALGTAGGLLSEFARAAAEEEVVFARLEQSIEATGRSYDEYSRQVERAIERGEDLAFADDQVADALARMTTVTGDAGAALDNINLAMDIARARNMSLSAAADLVGKVHEGNLGILSRYGIVVDENTTATEALALLQQRTAGQAQAYADTTQGALDRYRNSFDNLTESIGAHTGSLQALLALAPGITAMYSAIGGVIGAVGGLGTLGRVAPYAGAAALGGALAYGYYQDDKIAGYGTTPANQFANNLFLTGSELMNWAIPFFDPYNTQKYRDTMASNSVEDVVKQFIQLSAAEANYKPAEAFGAKLDLFDIVPSDLSGDGDYQRYIIEQATAAGMSVGEWMAWQFSMVPGAVRDPYTGKYNTVGGLRIETQRRTAAIGTLNDENYIGSPGTSGLAAAATTPDPFIGSPFRSSYRATGDGKWWTGGGGGLPEGASEYMRGGMGAVAMTGIGANDAATQEWFDTTKLENYRRALRETYGEYAGLVEGINSANDATRAFQATQDGILASQAPYNQQLQEYNGVLSDMEAGYKILQERQAEGIALTREEQEFLKNYDGLYARVSGGVEDATVANALLAAQYAENMSKGDQLNEMLAGNSEQTGNLVDAIELLILSMEGVPEEVRSRILLDNAAETQQSLSSIVSLLNSLDGRSATFYVNAAGNGVSIGNPNGPGITPLATGGMFSTAATGRMISSRYALVGENGPEMVALPSGSLVTPYGATRAAGGRGGGIVIQNMTVYANDPMEFSQQMRSRGLAEAWA